MGQCFPGTTPSTYVLRTHGLHTPCKRSTGNILGILKSEITYLMRTQMLVGIYTKTLGVRIRYVISDFRIPNIWCSLMNQRNSRRERVKSVYTGEGASIEHSMCHSPFWLPREAQDQKQVDSKKNQNAQRE